MKCKICGRIFPQWSGLQRHISRKHMPYLAYWAKYEGKSNFSKRHLRKMYFKEKKSTPMISEELNIMKQTLLKLMRFYGIRLRNPSSATKNQIARDGLWNKGKTKEDHPSIMRYAQARRGRNNPYFTAPGFEDRQRKSRERFRGIHRASCHNPTPKSTEGRMSAILDSAKIQYLQHFYTKYKSTWRIFDFLIEGILTLEMQGNYYHANPIRYKPGDLIVVSKKVKTAKDIWDYDEDKKQLAISKGYHYLAIWEDKFVLLSDTEALVKIREML